ncbi:thioesterase family protein [Nadsonia fulvescens var. elongata DSM 6958]|uniref:Thioesterase family protein n=1 Tax=Nadsonia fulvescens var. elongata DSM 6958 TaxID=857566 RepID=A0A1E3PEC6_9ASCO|nr:thioesterase family protein [Nadsonia fulvescens var. elongata DSM 6958]
MTNYSEEHHMIKNLPFYQKAVDSDRYIIEHPYEVEEAIQEFSLSSGVLSGGGLVAKTPISLRLKPELVEAEGQSENMVFYHLGPRLCGHKGIIHGGLLATLLDEALCRTGFQMLPNKIGVTASLNIKYLAPTKAESFIVIYSKTTAVDGRKCWVSGSLEVLNHEGDNNLKTVSAELLVVEPKWARKLTHEHSIVN